MKQTATLMMLLLACLATPYAYSEETDNTDDHFTWVRGSALKIPNKVSITNTHRNRVDAKPSLPH